MPRAFGRLKKRTQKKWRNAVKKTESQLLKTIKANVDVRGNIYAVPSVKRAMKRHSKALKEKEWEKTTGRRARRHAKRSK
jgi:hypothetical protein